MKDEAQEKIKLLSELIKLDISAGTTSRDSLKRKSFFMKLFIIIFSALVTITLGLQLGDIGKNVAVVLSAIVTALNTWDAFTTYHQRSIQEFTVSNKLGVLLRDIYLYLEGRSTYAIDDYEIFKKRYDTIYDEYVQQRIENHESNNDQNNEKK